MPPPKPVPTAEDLAGADIAAIKKVLTKRRAGLDAWIAWSHDEQQAADYIANLFPRDTLGIRAFSAANLIVTKILAGEVEVSGPNVAPVLNALINIARLEANEPTEVKAEFTAKERRELAATLREKVQARVKGEPLPIIEAEAEPDE